jgi:uncharacterized protein YbaP (TraB family)
MNCKSLFLALALCFAMQFLQAQGTPKTLLWRISGNQFTKPCYLYGTMHTNDKRVYYLGDSVYSSISFCDGFAMEIDPGDNVDTFMNTYESKQLNIAYKEAIENNLIKKDPNYYKRRQWELDSLYNKIRQRYNDLSARDIARLRRAYKQRDRNDMSTIFDLYLFDVAKTQGKTMGGLEDISGRAATLDELGNNFDPDLFLKNQRKKYVDVFEWMIVNYTGAELDKLHEFGKLGTTERYLSIMLNNRNNVMSKRIDSLGKIRSTFYAIGAAHLPGDSGVINLLKKRGFTVDPVFYSKKIEPGDYKINKRLNTLISISDMDSNYIVQMPGKPTDLTTITNKLFVKTYKELANEIMLMCGVHEDGNINRTIEKETDDVKSFFSWNDIKLYSSNKIDRQGLGGYELIFKSPEGYIRLHIFRKNGKTYMFAAGSKNRDSLQSARCENFMATYTMNLNKQQVETEMISFVSPDKAFSIALPAQPKKETINGAITYTKEDVTLFSSVDIKKKISYLVLLKEPFKGYFNDFDSSIFTQTINEVLKDVTAINMVEENVLLDDYPALKVKVRAQVDGKTNVIYTVLAVRHNRLYNLTARGLAVSGTELEFDKFINSFRFLPYQETVFKEQQGGGNLFSVMSPSAINILTTRAARSDKRTDYYAYDNSTAMSYGITALVLDKYYWAPEKNALLNEYARIHFNDSLAVNNIFGSDSLLYKKTVFNGNIEGRELLLKTLFNNSYSRIRIMHYGDSVFVINIKGAKELVTNTNADQFFNSFRFTKENFTTSAFSSKTVLLINDLQSADSNRSKPAAEALTKGFTFPQQDLHKVLDAFLYNYGAVNSNGSNVSIRLSQAIAPYAGEELFNFIRLNYPALSGKREDLRMLMLNILSASNNQQGYQVLKSLLLTDPPDADYTTVLSNLNRFPKMASTLFPEIAVKLKDDNLTPVVLDLANMLIDSNQIQISNIKEYETDIIRVGRKILKKYRDNNAENYNLPHTTAVLDMLAKMNQKQSKMLLNEFLELRNYNLTLEVILALVKNDQPVSAELIEGFCNTPNRRILLYDEFVKIGKQSFFTGQYANQKSFAEAFTTIYTTNEVDNYTPKYYDLVAIKEAVVKNERTRYYIYKVTCQFRRSTETFTGMIGPFSTNAADYSIKEGKELYILYRSTFDTNNIDKLFNDFIEQVKKMK